MNPLTLLLPILLGVALLVGALTGHVTPEQLAAGAALLMVPGADRYAPLVRQLLRLGPAQPALPSRDLTTDEMRAFIETAALAAYERYGDACGWRTVGGGQMPRWADQHERLRLCWREAARGALGLQPGVNPGELAPVVPVVLPASPPSPPAPPSPPPAALAFLVPFLLLAQGCGAFGTALKDCAVSSIPATVTEGVGVALRKGAGWEQALADVVKQFGLCMVKTEVGAVAARTPPITIASLEAASEGTVQEQEVAERARAWLRSHQ